MTVRIKKVTIGILSFILTLCLVAVCMGAIPIAAANLTKDSSPSELFGAQQGVTVETNVSGNTLKDGEGEILFPNENKTGVKLSTKEEGAEVELNKTFSGVFEIDLRGWSDTTIAEADGYFNDFEKVHTYDLRELQLIFEDSAGQTFTVHLFGGDIGNAIRGTVRVSVSGGKDKYAYHYNPDTGAQSSYRCNSYGTWLFGAGFSNRSRGFKYNFAPDETTSMIVGFDPVSMEVYGMGYGTDNKTLQRYTVWALNNELTNASFSGPAPTEEIRTLSSFGDDYTVTLKFADIEDGKTAKAVVYSVCGQSLAGTDSFTEDSGPAVLLKDMPLGTAERASDLSAAVDSINDFFEGKIAEFTGTISVSGPNGVTAELDGTNGYSYTPPQEGEYTLTYKAKDSAGNLGSAATITWTVLHADLDEGTAIESLWNASNTATLTSNTDSPSYAKPARGMLFTAETAGTTIEYKNKIKLQQDVPFIKLMAVPNELGSKDFDRIVLTLTDAHDPNNKLNITIHSGSWGDEYSYIRAGANNMRLGGWNRDERMMQYSETQGFVAMHSFTGASRGGSAEILSVFFDSESCALTVSPTPHAGEVTVIDFDNATYLGGQSPWYGFTNDEVYVSISLTMFTGSDSASILVTELNGQTLDGTYLWDSKEPVISFNLGEYEASSLPKALVGTGYRLFSAEAYDEADGDITDKIAVAAYYGYGSDAQKEIEVKNGVITPDAAGTITVVYSATDAFGNKAEETLTIEAKSTLDALNVQFDENIPSSLWVGERFAIPEFTLSGGSGNKIAELSVTADGNPVDFDGKTLYFAEEGTYVFTVRVTDYIGTVKQFDYEIEVSINEVPIIVVGEFAPAYIAGYSYDLPTATATDWFTQNGSPVDVPVKITACYAGETPFEVTGKFVPEKAGTVTIVYSAANSGDAGKIVEFEKTVTVLDGVGISGLFVTENGSITTTASGAIFSSSQNGVFRFANPVDADVFSLQLQLYTAGGLNYNAFRSFCVTLYECGNRANAVTVRLAPNELTSSYSLVSDAYSALFGKKVYVEFAFDGVSDTSAVMISQMCNQPFSSNPYDIIKPVITVHGTVPLEVAYGKIFTIPAASAFDVFDPNAVVYLTVYKPDNTLLCENAFIDEDIQVLADGYGTFNLEYYAYDHNGNKQMLTYSITVKDTKPPVIRINGDVPETGKAGDSISLPSADAFDNHSENVQVFMFVLAPDGKLFEADGSFKAEFEGEYTVYYYATDEALNYVRESFTITVSR